MKNPKKFLRDNWNYFVALFFFIWWIFDLKLNLIQYNSRGYLWFCSFSLLLIAIAFFLRSSLVLFSILPIAIIFQVYWMADFFNYLITKTTITLNIRDIFSRGYSPSNFVNTLRHFFEIPFILMGLGQFGKPKRYAGILTVVFTSIIVIGSYFITFPFENLNCSMRSCFSSSLEVKGFWLYTIPFLAIFLSLIIVIYLTLAHIIYQTNNYRKILNWALVIFMIIAIVGSLWGYVEYSKVPHYICKNGEKNIVCERAYISSEDNSSFIAFYFNGIEGNKCNVTANSKGEILNSTSIDINSNKSYYGLVGLEPPKNDIYIKLDLLCSPNR